jgi:hypothetical protein
LLYYELLAFGLLRAFSTWVMDHVIVEESADKHHFSSCPTTSPATHTRT